MLYRMTVDFNGIGLNETREELKDNKWVVVDKFHPNAVFQGTNTIEVSNGHIRLEKYFVRTDDCRIPERREYDGRMTNLEVAQCYVGNCRAYRNDPETVVANLDLIEELLKDPDAINENHSWEDFK